MKVVQVSTWKVPCGIAGYTEKLAASMLDSGVQCDIIPIERERLKYMAKNEISQYFESMIEKLVAYDVIHIQHEFSFFAGAYDLDTSISIFSYFLSRILKLQKLVFVTFHSEPSFFEESSQGSVVKIVKKKLSESKWNLLVSRLFNSKRNLNAIVHTKNSRRIFIDSGFNPNKIHILKQGISPIPILNVSQEQKISIKKELGFTADSIILSMFGFISHYKGYITALRALQNLPKDYYLIIIGMPHPYGTDKTLDNIIRLINDSKNNPIRSNNLDERVKMTGYLELEELNKYYSVTNFCLAPYEPETQLSSSAAITWALASGKPVVASKIRAFTEINEEADCFHLFTPGSARELAYQIKNLYANCDLQNKLVNNALNYCQENLWGKAVEAHIQLYQSFKH